MVCIFHKLTFTGAEWARQWRQGEPSEEEAPEDQAPLREVLSHAQGELGGVPSHDLRYDAQ